MRLFVSMILVGGLGLPSAALTLNVLVDPWLRFRTGLVPPAVVTDEVSKMTLVERLDHSPQIVILGNSRARALEPRYLTRLTGKRVFNAAVAAGTTADAWVFVHMIDDRFPDPARRYIWLVDPPIGSLFVKPSLHHDARARPHLPPGVPAAPTVLDRVADYLSADATSDSLRVLLKCVRGCEPLAYEPDGGIPGLSGRGPGDGERLRAKLRAQINDMRRRPYGGGTARMRYFAQLIAYMNAHVAPPVLVLTPMHPDGLAALRRLHDTRRRRAVQDIRALQRRLSFTFFDLTDIRRFNGDPNDFSDLSHMGVANMRRLVDYVVSHTRGGL
jgi:hypothetical protein